MLGAWFFVLSRAWRGLILVLTGRQGGGRGRARLCTAVPVCILELYLLAVTVHTLPRSSVYFI
jgi:hypothetical protein